VYQHTRPAASVQVPKRLVLQAPFWAVAVGEGQSVNSHVRDRGCSRLWLPMEGSVGGGRNCMGSGGVWHSPVWLGVSPTT
jgi:hypothetical protein